MRKFLLLIVMPMLFFSCSFISDSYDIGTDSKLYCSENYNDDMDAQKNCSSTFESLYDACELRNSLVTNPDGNKIDDCGEHAFDLGKKLNDEAREKLGKNATYFDVLNSQ